ncbi:MAG TPA: RNA polymerase sporulation sigma factor SigE [Candidatus Agathobaculum merdipullorum]|nr:RNA polymerase sporulation sigma factor SigE [uncultured Agathobaculum sp.]HIY12770.1 RNA polymerase sporulation sigma factor SigE [Candidatus Agathobaculum merdipullorum]
MVLKWIMQVLARWWNRRSVYYIGGSEVLPPPLSPEEEQAAVEACQAGDEQARNKLIEHNLRLVVFLARKFESAAVSTEDLISIGTIGLIKAVGTYRSDKNVKLATYASRCIENEILMHLRKLAGRRTEVSFDEPLSSDWDGNELLLSDILGTEPDSVMRPIEDDVDRMLVHHALERLPPRERQIISLRFGLGLPECMTQKEVAELLGISQSYISRLEKRIIARMRKDILKNFA